VEGQSPNQTGFSNSNSTGSSLWEHVLLYRSLGLNLFPVAYGTKRPKIAWKVFQERLAAWDELRKWFANGSANVAVVCGSISLGLFVQDFERRKDAEEFYPNFEQLCKSTLVAETPHGGIHVYAQTSVGVRRSIRICEEHPFDILGEGGYALAPPSMVDGKQYRFLSSSNEILWIAEDPLAVLIKRCRELGWKTRAPSYSQPAANTSPVAVKLDRMLTKDQRAQIVNALVPFWRPGRRHEMTIYLLGFLVKRGVARDDSEAILKAICQAAGDEEISQRLKQVSYHYEQRVRLLPRLRGFSGLKEVLGDATLE
jgi:hypothetical protein